MKKILSLILLTTLFVACGDDKEDEPEYLDPALIEGTWMFRTHTTDDEYQIFEKNGRYTNFYKDRYTGTLSSLREYKDYKISADRIYYKRSSDNKHLSVEYILESDSILKIKINNIYRAYQKIDK